MDAIEAGVRIALHSTGCRDVDAAVGAFRATKPYLFESGTSSKEPAAESATAIPPGFPPPPASGTPGGMMQRQSWVPPPSQSHVTPIRHVLTIDGHKIAEAVSHYIAKAATHVQSAAQFDGSLSHVPVDIAMA